MKRLFSGIQPSGSVGLGNYIGAIKPWLKLQSHYDCLFCLVDLHTLTVPQTPEALTQCSYDLLALYLACGLDVKKHHVFFQSQRYEHAQLAWLLNCYTGMGELNRMTQYKDKAQKQTNVGLFTYPVLMAADILLYDTNVVPVGADQKQHLELARDLAIRFNQKYGEIFVVPEPIIPEHGARIMSLQEPEKKMSKSDPNPKNYIALLDEPKVIEKKIKRAVTDSLAQVAADPERPGITNLLTIFSVVSGKTVPQLVNDYEGEGYGRFKQDLADCLIAELSPIQQAYRDLRAQPDYLNQICREGAEYARIIATRKLQQVHQALGLVCP